MQNNFCVIDYNKINWVDIQEKINKKNIDIFYLPSFLKSYSTLLEKHQKIKCALYSSGDSMILYPFIERKIFFFIKLKEYKKYKDTTGVYGRNWILKSQNVNLEEIKLFEKNLKSYFSKENIICSFDRMHPFIKNNFFFEDKKVTSLGKYFYIDLNLDINLIFKNFKKSFRKDLKKSNPNIFEFQKFSDLKGIKKFYQIYYNEIKRKKAKKFYLFKYNFFKNIFLNMKNNAIFFYIKDKKNNKICSVELILFSSIYSHSYLGATTVEGKKKYANHYLKFKIIEFLKEKKIQYFLLGSGQLPDDGIYKYKESIAKDSYVESKICFNIWDKKVYDKLKQNFKNKKKINKYQFYEKE